MTADLDPPTVLDRLHAAMAADPQDEAARLAFYHALADAGLFLMLEREAEDETLAPRVFDLADGPVILAFDSEERLASLGEGADGDADGGPDGGPHLGPVPYAVLPGRIVAAHLAGQGIALGLNLGTGAPSETLLPPEALVWLAGVLDQAPQSTDARPVRFDPPGRLPDALTGAIARALGQAGGLASAVLIAAVTYDDGRRGHMLAVLDARPGAEEALARAAGEALRFSGIEAGQMDVVFLSRTAPAAGAMARVGLRLDLAAPDDAATEAPAARAAPKGPGTDPQKPPILR